MPTAPADSGIGSPSTPTTRARLERREAAGYPKSLPDGAKAQTTRKTEESHVSHLSRHLKLPRLAQTVTTADMQTYIDRRLHDKY